MKIAYQHILKNLKEKPSIDEISEKLFQLGHEHEIIDNVFHMEFTPNRGDCLSVLGLCRDLSVFYKTELNYDIYKGQLKPLKIDFINNAKKSCPHISFLKIEIGENIRPYSKDLESYFSVMNVKKNNFFTDISNYVSYEIGHPTHCYDASKINSSIYIEKRNDTGIFKTLLDTELELTGPNLVFYSKDEIINLAGIIGSKSTACSKTTNSVLVECAYFNPEEIIGKSVQYDIQSEAAYKFERGVDPLSQEQVLRRFLKIVSEHTDILNVSYFSKNYSAYKYSSVDNNLREINKILGINLSVNKFEHYLKSLNFKIDDKNITPPSYRSDIYSCNDIAEEIARVIGYDNIPRKEFQLPKKALSKKFNSEENIKNLLIDNGFYQVINNSFVPKSKSELMIKVDNPLDSNREYLRLDLKDSLVNNLLYNERRQQDSIKLFEISDIYFLSNGIQKKRILGIIASGRVGKNYKHFAKKININYLEKIFASADLKIKSNIVNIPRDNLDTKLKTPIIYSELELDEGSLSLKKYIQISKPSTLFKKYVPISEYPSSSRDLSFALKDLNQLKELEKLIFNFEHELLKDVYIFDYYKNEKVQEIKIGFRFVIQSSKRTITDDDVASVIDDIIKLALKLKGVKVPGLKI